MKNLLCSLPAKITAIILSYVMVLVIVLSTAAAMVMGYMEFYTHSSRQMQKTILNEMAVGEGYWLSNLLQNSGLNVLREEIGDNQSFTYTYINTHWIGRDDTKQRTLNRSDLMQTDEGHQPRTILKLCLYRYRGIMTAKIAHKERI